MRFRQAYSVLARAIEETQKYQKRTDGSVVTFSLCNLLCVVHEVHQEGAVYHRSMGNLYPNRMAATLAAVGGFTQAHAEELTKHIHAELARRPHSAYLPTVWVELDGAKLPSDDHNARVEASAKLRVQWLRTLGRSKPARVK